MIIDYEFEYGSALRVVVSEELPRFSQAPENSAVAHAVATILASAEMEASVEIVKLADPTIKLDARLTGSAKDRHMVFFRVQKTWFSFCLALAAAALATSAAGVGLNVLKALRELWNGLVVLRGEKYQHAMKAYEGLVGLSRESLVGAHSAAAIHMWISRYDDGFTLEQAQDGLAQLKDRDLVSVSIGESREKAGALCDGELWAAKV
jgi:hypothetical protein